MAPEFSEAGYTEVYRGSTLVSRHRQEREAIESVLRDAESAGGMEYEIRRPVIRVTLRPVVVVTGLIDGAGALPR